MLIRRTVRGGSHRDSRKVFHCNVAFACRRGQKKRSRAKIWGAESGPVFGTTPTNYDRDRDRKTTPRFSCTANPGSTKTSLQSSWRGPPALSSSVSLGNAAPGGTARRRTRHRRLQRRTHCRWHLPDTAVPEAIARERFRHSCCHLAHTSLFAGARLQLSFRPRTHLCNSSSRWKESAMRAAALPGHNEASTGDAPSSPGACDDSDLVSARGSTPGRTAWHRFPLGAAASPEWPATLRRKNKSGAS